MKTLDGHHVSGISSIHIHAKAARKARITPIPGLFCAIQSRFTRFAAKAL